jgi:Rrf2 family protein
MLIYLTRNQRTVSSTELAENMSVSQRYLLQIAGKLRDGGLIGVYKGVSGGFYLPLAPSEINMYDIIALMEGGISILRRSDVKGDYKMLSGALNLLKDYLETYLRTMTLERLAAKSMGEYQQLIAGMVREHIALLEAES